MTPFQAKKFVEDLPQNVKEKASKEEVEEVKKVLEAVGGTVEIEAWDIFLKYFVIMIHLLSHSSSCLSITSNIHLWVREEYGINNYLNDLLSWAKSNLPFYIIASLAIKTSWHQKSKSNYKQFIIVYCQTFISEWERNTVLITIWMICWAGQNQTYLFTSSLVWPLKLHGIRSQSQTTNNLSLYTVVLVVICHSSISSVYNLAYNYLHKHHSLQKQNVAENNNKVFKTKQFSSFCPYQ